MQAVDQALQVGRHLQRKQTSFVHYCHQSEEDKVHDTIPVLENALFALALFRSRLSDHVLEGKALIEKLLFFEKEGNFPLYLHKWPKCCDPYLGLRLLPVFFWIEADFSHVIGDLKERLTHCIDRIIKGAAKLDLPPWGKFRLQAMQKEVGELPRETLIKDGFAQCLPKTIHEWSEALVSLQIAEKKGADISLAIEEACSFWHPEISLYVGPNFRLDQEGFFPKLTLYDLFMCAWQNAYPKRAKHLCCIHLKGALIFPREVSFTSKPVPFITQEPSLYIAWDEHTFVLAKKEEEYIANFYLNYHIDHTILINGKRATAFQQGDRVEIHSKGLKLALSFSAEDGMYFGSLMRGNRPAQHGCKGENQFFAYDWRIAIYAVQKGKTPMRVKLHLQTQENQLPSPLHASHCPHIELSL